MPHQIHGGPHRRSRCAPHFQYFVHSARGATNPTGCGKTSHRLRDNRTSTRADFLTEFSRRRTRKGRDQVAGYDEVRAPCPDAAQRRIRYGAHSGLRAFRDCPIAYVQAIKAQMDSDLENLAARAAPAIFVVLWSTGFIATKYVVHNADPLTYLAIRMALVVWMMAVIVWTLQPKWPGVGHSVVAGILVHGFYLGGIAIAISHSIPAGLSALIPGLQPILTSTLANRWLGERVTPLQWTGLLLGLAGVVLIMHGRPMSGQAGWGWLASAVSLVSITLGTLYQRRYCGKIDWRAGNLVQYIAVAIFFATGAALFERNVVHWTSEFLLSLIWLAVMLSIGSIGLLYWLIKRSAASSVASLFYLVPAVTSIMAYVLFGERLDGIAVAGMPVCAAAVFLVNRRAQA